MHTFTDNDIPLPLGVTLGALNDGSGVAKTLLSNKAKYHNVCRTKVRAYVAERAIAKRKQQESDDEEETVSPKKTRSSFIASFDREKYSVRKMWTVAGE